MPATRWRSGLRISIRRGLRNDTENGEHTRYHRARRVGNCANCGAVAMNVPTELTKLLASVEARLIENEADIRRNTRRMIELIQEKRELREAIDGIKAERERLNE